MNADKFFLCFGYPKSGTTFLQRMIDMHPEVSCPSEQALSVIFKNLQEFLPKYGNLLEKIDFRTGGQGAPTISDHLTWRIFRDTVLNLSLEFSGGKPIHGLNENTVARNFILYDELFDRPKMICIFRNPVDRALSVWRRNQRLAKAETEHANLYLQNLKNPENSLEGFLNLDSERFIERAESYVNYVRGRPNFLTIRYEDLIDDKKNQLEILFDFLEVEDSKKIIDNIVAKSTKEFMAENSPNPAFFGLGRERKENITVNSDFRNSIFNRCASSLESLGYNLTVLRDGWTGVSANK